MPLRSSFEFIDGEVWREKAQCRDGSGGITELFFSLELDDISRAKEFCDICPVRGECLSSALERREPNGVWGGELFESGRILPAPRKPGRPPKAV